MGAAAKTTHDNQRPLRLGSSYRYSTKEKVRTHFLSSLCSYGWTVGQAGHFSLGTATDREGKFWIQTNWKKFTLCCDLHIYIYIYIYIYICKSHPNSTIQVQIMKEDFWDSSNSNSVEKGINSWFLHPAMSKALDRLDSFKNILNSENKFYNFVKTVLNATFWYLSSSSLYRVIYKTNQVIL